ncbi:MAG: hypothetical protein CME13_01220 [Gemmatimonadetes bacterium]|nr:hypothetical protein [Gemmatimonadota bacterium]
MREYGSPHLLAVFEDARLCACVDLGLRAGYQCANLSCLFRCGGGDACSLDAVVAHDAVVCTKPDHPVRRTGHGLRALAPQLMEGPPPPGLQNGSGCTGS